MNEKDFHWHLRALYAGMQGYAELRAYRDTESRRKWVRLPGTDTDWASAWFWAQQHADWNIVAGVLPRRDDTSGRKENVLMAGWIWAEVDACEEIPPSALGYHWGASRNRIPRPHLVVFSGRGAHCYWRLRAPLQAGDSDWHRSYAHLLRRLAILIDRCAEKSEAAHLGMHCDIACAETARCLRVAGTFNPKRGQVARVLQWHPSEPAWTYAQWDKVLPALPEPHRILPPSAASTSFPSTPERLEELARMPYPEGQRHRRLCGWARFLMHDVGLPPAETERLVRLRGQVSHLPDNEIESIVHWMYRIYQR